MKIQNGFVAILTLAFTLLTSLVQGQNSPARHEQSDSAKTKMQGFQSRIQEFARKSSKESMEDFKSDKVAMVQLEVINLIRLTVQDAKGYLKPVVDTTFFKTKLSRLKTDYRTAAEGVFIHPGTTQTYRNLATTKRVLRELFTDARKIKTTLESRQKRIASFHYRIDSLSTAPELFIFPKDSVQAVDYIRTLASVAVEAAPVDSILKASNISLQKLLNSYNIASSEFQHAIEQVETFERLMADETFKRELPDIWGKQLHFRPFKDILSFSISKNLLTFKFYIFNNAGKLSLIALLILSSFIYLNALQKIYREKGLLSKNMAGQLVIRYPALSAVLIVLSLFQFLLVSPPFSLSFLIWLVSCISLTVVFRNFITGYWMKVWLAMVMCFILASAGNLLLQASRPERWYMLWVALIGAVAGILILTQRRRDELREKYIYYSIIIMVFLEFISIMLNVYGRFNLAKTLFMAGFLNVVIAILFLWVVRLINEGLLLAYEVYTVQDKKLFYLNFDKVGNRAPTFLYIMLLLGWILQLGHNFPLFDLLSRPFLDFMGAERTIGNYNFSINGIIIFLVIMTISVILSKIVTFFTSDEHLIKDKGDNQIKRGLGSWVLLLRISVLTIGLFIAVAAAGIPMERITIVVGALGVGIGFGLQTLVNNLVSGLIIAFEKPVNVGDIVDIDGQGGTMKSIGFRSSVITTWDGGDLVMPNGDLLNSHLINWTLSGNRRRLTLIIGIDYGADLEKCRTIVTQILEGDERILKKPRPTVNFELFGSSSIELKIQLWTPHLNENNSTKNDLIIALNEAFKTNNIKIPISQQDIYLHRGKDLT